MLDIDIDKNNIRPYIPQGIYGIWRASHDCANFEHDPEKQHRSLVVFGSFFVTLQHDRKCIFPGNIALYIRRLDSTTYV